MIKYQGLATLEILEDAKEYNKWIADQIHKNLASPVLEIGAGTGNLSAHFLDYKLFHVTDIDPGLVSYVKKRFAKDKNVHAQVLDISKKPPTKYHKYFRTIFAVNVLEHIKDDVSALVHMHTMLQKKGKLVLLVPAKKYAYTKLDQKLGHHRRYEKKELESLLQKANFDVQKIYFFNIVGLISWIVRDKVDRNQIGLKPYHIKIFDSIVPILRVIESFIQMPTGISLIIVAQKKAHE